MRRRSIILVLAALVSAPFAASSLAADGPQLSRAGEAKFPHRSYVLALPPGVSAESNDVDVFENDMAVRDLSVEAAGSSAEAETGTVLVIDATYTMRGAPIRRAMAAARAFAEHRQPSQKLGVVTFDRKAHTLLEPTTDDAAIDAALATTPPVKKWTHIRDAALAGLKSLDDVNVDLGSVIVLSDGADTGSRASAEKVARAASSLGARVFTVGLESGSFNPRTLHRLAALSGGEYAAAESSKDLAPIYDALGAKLAREYLVRYSSVAGPGKRIIVKAVVDGLPGSVTLEYRSPKLAAGSTAPPVEPEAQGFWGSAAAMIVVAFGTAFLLCFALAWILIDRRRPETPEERVAAFVAAGAEPEPEEPKADDAVDGLYTRIEAQLRDHKWWQQFALDVEIARFERTPVRIAVMTGIATLVTMWLFAAISGAGWVALLALLIPWGVRKYVAHRAAKQRVLFGEQLTDNLQVVASAMRAGQSFAGALAAAAEDASEPAKTEFQRVVADEQLGVPVETALGSVVERMENNDLQQVALVASLQREAGGNAAEVLERVAENIRERVALRRLIATLTAQGRMSRWVVSLIPAALVLLIGLTNPTYLDPLFTTTAGNVMLGIAAAMVIGGSIIIQKIVDIEA